MEIFPLYLNYKKLKKLECKMIAVNVEPVKLPFAPPVDMRRYPMKGGMDEITKTLRDLLKEGVVEPTRSFNYNSPVWAVLKPNGKWRFTVHDRRINEVTPNLRGR